MKHRLNFLIGIMVLTSLIACQKKIDIATEVKSGISENEDCYCDREQAFPDIPGEIITIAREGGDITIEKKGNRYVYLGDILLTEEQVEKLRNGAASRTAIADFAKYWGGGIVVYRISPSLPNQQRVLDAIAHWQNNTGVRFVVRTNQADYVDFVPGSGCSSYIGKIGGRQEVILDAACSAGNAIHEIGHAIGFFHEQSRTDRDNSIIINWGNIQSGMAHNFQTYAQLGTPGFQLGAFDFNSVMMYGSFAFSNNSLPTITTLGGGTFVGQRIGLSPGDIETSNFIYGPPFGKFRMVLANSSDDGSYRTSDLEFYVDFFQDHACTIPATMPNDRNMVVSKFIQDNYGSGWYVTSNSSYPVFVGAGSSSVLIGTASNWEQYSEYNGEVTIHAGHSEYCYTREAFLR